MTKKITAAILALICILTLWSCGEKEKSTESVFANEWTVVYSASSPTDKELAEAFKTKLKEKCGLELPMRSDYESDSDQKEILIGSTNRSLSASAAEELNTLSFRIKKEGNKVAIVAAVGSVMERAFDYFIENFVSEEHFAFPENLDYVSEAAEFLQLAADKKSDWRIVYSAEADDAIKATVTGLNSSFTELCGAFIPVGIDDAPATDKEIILGISAREEAQAVLSELEYNQYKITVVNGKIVIAAWSNVTLKQAVGEFVKLLKSSIYDGMILLDGDSLSLTGSTATFSDIDLPAYPAGEIKGIYDCGDGVSEILIDDTTASDFSAYKSALLAAEYVLYDEHTANNNLYAVYNKASDDRSVFVSYTNSTKVAKIIVSPLEEMLPKEPEVKTKIADTTFAMLAVGNEFNGAKAYGASFVIRLEDGRFVVIDGGMNVTSEVDELYSYLNNNKTSSHSKPQIAAWIITHPHGDHYGVLSGFASKHGSKVELERMIYNVSADSGFSPEAGENQIKASTGFGSIAAQAMNKMNCKTAVKVHTGQEFYLGNVKFEVLFTHEDLYPGLFKYVNDLSIVFMVSIENKKLLLTGDIEGDATKQLMTQFGDYLKCDYIQIAHHGWGSGGAAAATAYNVAQYDKLYKQSGASYALWTAQLDADHYAMLDKGSHMKTVRKYFSNDNILSTKTGDVIISDF